MSGSSAWGEQAFAWMVQHARPPTVPGGPTPPAPKAVVLGAIPLDEPDDRIPALIKAGCAAAEGLVVPEDGGDNAKAHDLLAAATVIFIRGGDQGRYVKGWRGRKAEVAIRSVFQRGGVVAGTSAGCAILGEVTYTAEKSSLTPEEALSDPFHEDLILARGFLGFVPGVLFDTHFTERGRVARLPAMLARARELFDDSRDVLGMGMDPRTAAACEPDGLCKIMGEGTASLMRLTSASRVALEKGKPPTITDIRYDQLLTGTTVSLPDGRVTARPLNVLPNPHPEVVDETTFEALTLDGAAEDTGKAGVQRAVREGEGDAQAWKTLTGDGRLPASIVAPQAWERGVWERVAMLQRAVADQPGLLAWWFGAGCTVDVDTAGLARVRAGSTSSVVILDTRGVSHVGIVEHAKGRHKAHLENARLHVLGPGWGLNLRTREVVPPAEVPKPATP